MPKINPNVEINFGTTPLYEREPEHLLTPAEIERLRARAEMADELAVELEIALYMFVDVTRENETCGACGRILSSTQTHADWCPCERWKRLLVADALKGDHA